MFDRKNASEQFRFAVRKIGTITDYDIDSSGRDPNHPMSMLVSIFRTPLTTITTASNTEVVDGGVNKNNQTESFVADNGTDWSNVLNPWLDAYEASMKGQAVQCYDNQAMLHAAFNQLFSSSSGNILVPILIEICKCTHRLAVLADIACTSGVSRSSNDHAKLNNAALLLQESYSKSYGDRKELQPNAPYNNVDGSKKVAVLFLVNELFRIYFRLNTLRLCKNVAKPTEAKKLHEQGTMGQMITYKYFSGRLCLFEDNFVHAEQHLEYAYDNCPISAMHNKRCILRYLIPVKLYRGKLPTKQLLEEYNLVEFINVVDGIKRGDLRIFHDALLEYQHLFIRQGTYLLLERCKSVCYRSLLLRIYRIMNKPYISLDSIVDAFKWLQIADVTIDEVECILANLIYRGIIRGYIAHTKRMLVLSKTNAFPVENLGSR